MFGFVKQVFAVAMAFFSFNVLILNHLECFSMNNQECKTKINKQNEQIDEYK